MIDAILAPVPDSSPIPRHRLRVRLAALLTVAFLLSPGHPVAAQGSPPEDSGLEEDPRARTRSELTERVVVTATRQETAADRVGSSVSIVTAQEIEERQIRLGVDALRQVPGLDVRRSGGPGTSTSLFMRGMDSDHTLVLLDGVELNDPSAPSRVPFIDHLTLDSVERVEVLRGPQSTLYGSDAMGGVVHFITRRGAGENRSSFTAEGGSFSSFRGAFNTSGGDDRLDYFVSASHADSDGFSTSSAGTEDDPYRSTALAGRLGLKFGEGRGVDLFVHDIRSKTAFDGFLVESGNFIDSDQTVVRIAPYLDLRDGRWSQRFGVRYSSHERNTSGDFPSVVNGELLAIDWQNDVELSERQTLTIGLDHQWEEARFSTYDDRTRTLGLYVQDRFAVAEKLFGTVGMRWDDHGRFGSETTFRATGGWRPGGGRTTLRASFGTGFKAPALSELNAVAFGGNPDLAPETSRGFDIGWEYTRGDRGPTVTATFFENRVDDLIIAVFDAGTGAFLNVNVDEAEARGVELAVHLASTSPVSFRAGYTYTDSAATGSPQGFGLSDGSSLLRRPRHKGSVALGHRFHEGKIYLGGQLSYVGTRDDIDPLSFSVARADSYARVDLSASAEVSSTWRLFARIDNLLDADYEEILGFGTAGRSGHAGVKLIF